MHLVILAVATIALATTAAAQDRRGTRFWNLTLSTITTLQLSPAGRETWGANQCENDRDGTVEHNERLRVTGVTPGRYDVRLVDKTGRTCTVRAIDVADGAIFSIEEKDLTDCNER
jgi:hypothetical protein